MNIFKSQLPVIADEDKIEEFLNRGIENFYPDRETVKKALMSGKRLKIYCGFDPTAKALHIGHGIQIRKLEKLRQLGHEVIFLYGGFTAMVGDPTDKAQARKALTASEVKANAMGWKTQIENIVDTSKIIFKNNHDWLSKLKFADILQLTAYFTAQQMLTRDMFQRRIEDGKDLYLNEFMYPLMQAYDSVAMDVDMELGGNDQMFNMLAGRTLMKKMKGKEKLVITSKLLEDPSGKKMGKSEGNAISLTDSAEDMFGKIMSWPDTIITTAMNILTDISIAEIKEWEKKLTEGVNPRDAKLALAYEVVKIYKGEKGAEDGKNYFARVFQEKEKPMEIKEIKIDFEGDEIGVLDLFFQAGLTTSNGEGRRLITEKGLKIDDELVTAVEMKVKLPETGLLLQRGKKQFVRVMR